MDARRPRWGSLSRKAILEQVDASLARLGTDYIDLYQIHRFDPHTPVEETMEVLHDVVKAGKVRYIGASSMYAWQFAKLQHAARCRRLDTVCVDAEPVQPAAPSRRTRVDGDVRRHGRGNHLVLPECEGRLARPAGEQSRRSDTDKVVQAFDSPYDEPVINAVQELAEARGVTMAQIALAWVLTQPARLRTDRRSDQAEPPTEAVDALALRLEDDEVQELEGPYQQYGPSWY